jgi:hypothetical protein
LTLQCLHRLILELLVQPVQPEEDVTCVGRIGKGLSLGSVGFACRLRA